MVYWFLTLFLSFTLACDRPGGPLPQEILENFVKNFIKSEIPVSLPDFSLNVKDTLSLSVTNNVLNKASFKSSGLTLPKADHLVFNINGLSAGLSFNFNVTAQGSAPIVGSAQLSILARLSVTNLIKPDSFLVSSASFVVSDLEFHASNQPVIQPYWDLLRPVVIDLLQTGVPDVLKRTLTTEEIRSLVRPIILGLEPIHIPDINQTILGVTGSFTKALMTGIDFTAATLQRGSKSNEVSLSLVGVTAMINNNWEFKERIFGIDKKGTGSISLAGASVDITIGLGMSSGNLTVNLDDSKLVIGDLKIKLNGSGVDEKIVNWLIMELLPLVENVIQNTFGEILCFLFDFAPT